MTQTRIPSYHLHKATGQAVVVLRGRSVYTGMYNTPESRNKYDRVIARYLADRAVPDRAITKPPDTIAPAANLSVSELILRYWRFAKAYYVKNGQPTGELYPLQQTPDPDSFVLGSE